jgi:phage-related protein
MVRRIELFETDNGRCPVADYIIEAERFRRERAKIMRVFEAVQNIPQLPSNMFKKLSGRGNLWEIRVGQHRFLGFFHRNDLLVLVHAFTKQSQKTPTHDIEVALGRQRAYISRQP